MSIPPTPSWLALLPLPGGLDDSFRNWLIHYVADHLSPRTQHEDWLAARIAQAMARLHLLARLEPERIDPLWLRAETAADRQLRHALKAWLDYRRQATATPGNPSRPPSVSPSSATDQPRSHQPQSTSAPLGDLCLSHLPTTLAAFIDLPIGRPRASGSDRPIAQPRTLDSDGLSGQARTSGIDPPSRPQSAPA